MLKFWKQNIWFRFGCCVSVICAILFSCFYGLVCNLQNNKYTNEIISQLENTSNLNWLYDNCYLLYSDLWEQKNGQTKDYLQLYFEEKDTDNFYISNFLRSVSNDSEITVESENEGTFKEKYGITYEEAQLLMQGFSNYRNYFQILEVDFSRLSQSYDYVITDTISGDSISNMSQQQIDNLPESNPAFLITFLFDENGTPSIGDIIYGSDDSSIRKNASAIMRGEQFLKKVENSEDITVQKYYSVKQPNSCSVTFSVPQDALKKENNVTTFATQYGRLDYNLWSYESAYLIRQGIEQDCLFPFAIFAIFVMMLGFFIPSLKEEKAWEHFRIQKLPFEGLIFCILLLYWTLYQVFSIINYIPAKISNGIYVSVGFNILLCMVYFYACWYLGVSVRIIREKGIRTYLKEKSLVYRFFPFVKEKWLSFYHEVKNLDLTKNTKKTIKKIVIINGIILFLMCSLWIGGFAASIIYSVILYFVLMKYVNRLQDKYRIMLEATNAIAEGNLNIEIKEDLGIFEPFKPELLKIKQGFQKAVAEEVKSQQLKSELITNVSHDLKTPLTAIITYVNLLKEEGLSDDQRRQYLEVLDRKSLRLKALIEDLFEVSKATTNNISLNITDVDIINLLKQAYLEFSDKLSEADLDVRIHLSDEKVLLKLDSQKTFRIYQNLLINIAKYAMKGTRVYINGFVLDNHMIITLKNISAQELSVESTDLTERFVRGDHSRNTEGSGLGLAIAKSFTELQGGQFQLETDGDLFKVITTWPLPID